jgi:uncharacterized protein
LWKIKKMKVFQRVIEEKMSERLRAGKVLVLFGARRTGKTFLLKQMMQKSTEPILFLNGEDADVQRNLANRSTVHYRALLGNCRLLIIDEAQKIPNIGAILKLMVDEIEGLKVIATGSSAFDMNQQFGEPLTGRRIALRLFPIAEMEWAVQENFIEQDANMRERLVFGSYPELINLVERAEKTECLKETISSYLLKDVLELEGIRYSGKIIDLLRHVAYQAANEVSLNELARQVGLDVKTVDKYLDLLEQVFVIFRIRGFSLNMRKEVVKSCKFYFYDNGIRNAIISNLNPIEIRNDIGVLWENYMVSERVKYQNYTGMLVNNFFWRTYDQQEIDWVEEREGRLFGYEFKWGKTFAKTPEAWKLAYPDASFEVIHPNNFKDFIVKTT